MLNKMMTFEKIEVEVAEFDGIPMFELYSTGAALGQTVVAKGRIYPNKERINKNVENAEIKPVLRNAKRWITESQLYELMLEVKTDKVRPFRKWITNEVLPSLRKTGTYFMTKKPTIKEPDEAMKPTVKYYRGEPVVTLRDLAYYALADVSAVRYYFNNRKRCMVYGTDYFLLEGAELHDFKVKNKMDKLVSTLIIITKQGFLKLSRKVPSLPKRLDCFSDCNKSKKQTLATDIEQGFQQMLETGADILPNAFPAGCAWPEPMVKKRTGAIRRIETCVSTIQVLVSFAQAETDSKRLESYKDVMKKTCLFLAMSASELQ